MGFQIVNIKCQKCGCETSEIIPTENGTAAMCTQCMNIIKLNDSKILLSQVECPYCHSTNTSKITTSSKVVNTALWGILGTKRYKNYHCNNCHSDF